jgi:hypothetical protein
MVNAVQVPNIGNGSTEAYIVISTFFPTVPFHGATNAYSFGWPDGHLVIYRLVGGVQTQPLNIAFNATSMAWWRIGPGMSGVVDCWSGSWGREEDES